MAVTDQSIVARERTYTDFDFPFRANPVTGDVGIKKDVEAVKQSVINILLTSPGERPFDPLFGCDIRSQLFENYDPILEAILDEQIRTSLRNYEPRVEVLNVAVSGRPDNNKVDITVEIEIQSPEVVATSVNVTIERLR